MAPEVWGQPAKREAISKDMTILKSVLEEMFQTQWKAYGTRVRIKSSSRLSLLGNRGGIQHTYIPGYGITFIIEGGQPAFVIFSNDENGNSSSFVFQNSFDSTTDTEQVNKETIITRIKTFLKDYGATAGTLPPDERITVMYKNRNYNEHEINRIRKMSEDDESVEALPNISVTAAKADLEAYQSGKLSVQKIDERISVSTSDVEETGPMDVRIMGNILKTALTEQPEESAFSGSRTSVNHLVLDNFGVLYFIDYSTPPPPPTMFQNNFDSFDFSFDMDDDFEALEDSLVNVMKKQQEQRRLQQEKIRQERQKKQQEREHYYRTQYDSLLMNLKTTLADYGHTLKSIKREQQVMLSVNFRSNFQNVPDRVDIMVKKAVLEDISRGKLTAEEAFGKMVINEN